MPPYIALLDLGTAITDVLAFLGPADQHKLRCTSAAMCEWFDSAAENGSLAFFVTFAPPSAAAAGRLRWRHATANPRAAEQVGFDTTPSTTVMVHLRNYCLSSFNNVHAGNEADDAIIECAAIRLFDDFAFEHKLVVTGLFGIRSIGDGFCSGVKAVEIELRGEDSELQSVGYYWLSECPNLRSVTFDGFTALEEVGDCWMSNCSSLESIIFAGDMAKLRKVGSGWMSYCLNLRHVDLSGFTALEEVGDKWMFTCSNLVSITFANNKAKLRKVGSGWLSYCLALKHVDLTGFAALEEVGSWMSSCSSLESIAFASDMSKLRKVGDFWMSSCKKLKHVDLTGFTALERVGSYWMSDCTKLRHVDLAGLNALEEVGDCWMSCSSLVSIAFANNMAKLTTVGNGWMFSCSSLKHVDLTGFTALERVGDCWMSSCSSLQSVAFANNMSKLTKVGNSWMSSCKKLKHVDLTGFTALEEVGGDWLYECSSLVSIAFASDMPKLKKVGKSWTPQSACSLTDYLLRLTKDKSQCSVCSLM